MHPGAARPRHQSLFRRGADQRGLPLPQSLGAGRGQARRSPSGDRLHLWRRRNARLVRHGQLRRREHGQTRRHLRQLQLSRRHARLHGASRTHGRARRPFRQLRLSRPERGAEMGARQYRRLWRRSRQGHHHRPVLWRGRGGRADHEPAVEGPVPRRGDDERLQFRRQRHDRRRGAAGRRREGGSRPAEASGCCGSRGHAQCPGRPHPGAAGGKPARPQRAAACARRP